MEVILGPGTREPPGGVNTTQWTEAVGIARFSEAEEEIKNYLEERGIHLPQENSRERSRAMKAIRINHKSAHRRQNQFLKTCGQAQKAVTQFHIVPVK